MAKTRQSVGRPTTPADGAPPAGLRLLRWIQSHGLTQAETAERTGIPPDKLNRIIRGHRPPSLSDACAIERIAGIPPRAWLPDCGVGDGAVD